MGEALLLPFFYKNQLMGLLENIKTKVVCRKIENEMVLVPLVNDVAQMNVIYTLNEVAVFIWDNIDAVSNLEEMTMLVVDNFDVGADTARMDIQSFLNELNNI